MLLSLTLLTACTVDQPERQQSPLTCKPLHRSNSPALRTHQGEAVFRRHRQCQGHGYVRNRHSPSVEDAVGRRHLLLSSRNADNIGRWYDRTAVQCS